jgi:hypothetical protein
VAGLEKKRFSEPDERVLFPGIVEELIEIGGFTLGRTTHAPGWRYSTDMGALVGEEWCETRQGILRLPGMKERADLLTRWCQGD